MNTSLSLMRGVRKGAFPAISAAALVMILLGAATAEYAPNVRTNAELDRFISGVCTAHRIAYPRSFFSQPMSVRDLQPFFRSADSLAAKGRLSPQEVRRLSLVKRLVNGDGAAYSWKKDTADMSGHISIGLLGKVRLRSRDTTGVLLRGTLSPAMTGNAGALSVFAGIDVSTDYISDSQYTQSSYQPYDGVPYNLYGRAASSHLRSTDMLRGGVRFLLPHLDIETAVDHLKFGPGVCSPVTISGTAPPATYFRARLDMGLLDYIHVFGTLRSQRDKSKYFYIHRLDAPLLGDAIRIGINEMIVNGSSTTQTLPDAVRPELQGVERTWEWTYMIPFVPYSFAEHYLGDRDNKAVSFDLNVRLPRAVRLYGEVLLDDITAPWTILSDDWGNKWALDAGAEWFTTVFSRDLSASVEYSRVEPWVYTHFYGGSHNFAHFGQSLGAPLGPNSDNLRLDVSLETLSWLNAGLMLDSKRTNTAARGGRITDVFQEEPFITVNDTLVPNPRLDSKKKRFLGPGTRHVLQTGITLSIMPFQVFNANAQILAEFEDGKPGFAFNAWGGLQF